MESRRGDRHVIAVFGAAGHTGRFVVAELIRRGIRPIAIARDAVALAAANFPVAESAEGNGGGEVLRRQASAGDPQSLDQALSGAHAVINCAGPFLETADSVAAAALRAGIQYLDVSAEQQSTREILDKYNEAAQDAGVAVLPAMGFYGGFADLLVTAALGDWDRAETIDILIGLDSWHPTRGTRITSARNIARRMAVAQGRLVPVMMPAAEKHWDFGDPIGAQTMIEVPFSEIILIERHTKATELHTWLNRTALGDVRDQATPAPQAVDARGRSAQRFVVDAVVRRDGKSRRITARGQDIYAFSAALVCEAAVRLLGGGFRSAGAQAPGAILDAQETLAALTPEHLTFETLAD